VGPWVLITETWYKLNGLSTAGYIVCHEEHASSVNRSRPALAALLRQHRTLRHAGPAPWSLTSSSRL